jgi:hypothetical protein
MFSNGSEPSDGSCLDRLPRWCRRPGVKLSNGEYEVHDIGVDRPHHVFVDESFKVAGAD